MRISDWSSDVCSSDLFHAETGGPGGLGRIDVEARALPEIIRLVVGHVLAARARVGGDEDHAVCGAGGAILALLGDVGVGAGEPRSEEHTSELQSLMRISYAVFCLKKKRQTIQK